MWYSSSLKRFADAVRPWSSSINSSLSWSPTSKESSNSFASVNDMKPSDSIFSIFGSFPTSANSCASPSFTTVMTLFTE